jgi:flagellar biosynthesis protein FlhF
MLVSTFRGRTTSEALARVREALGPEACVLETRRGAAGVEVLAAAERPGPRLTRPSGPERPEIAADEPLRDALLAQGFSAAFAERIASAAAANLDPATRDRVQAALAYSRELLALWLPVTPADDARGGATRFTVLVGSPGVGKTTTLAKIAAREVAAARRGVVLCSADHRRLGGLEQTAAFARVLGVPFRPLVERRDLDEARELAGPGGHVLVDTPGIARGRDADLDRLRTLLTGVQREEIELLLAADRDADTLADTVQRFRPLRPGRVGATRIDETVRPGALVSALVRAALPLCHVSSGPEVPEDLAHADPRALARWALPLDPRVRRPASETMLQENA